MLKAIVLAAILGMVFPVAGHLASRGVGNNWLRFGISIVALIISIFVTYFIALIFEW